MTCSPGSEARQKDNAGEEMCGEWSPANRTDGASLAVARRFASSFATRRAFQARRNSYGFCGYGATSSDLPRVAFRILSLPGERI